MTGDPALPPAIAKRPLLALFLRYKERLAFLVLIVGLLLIGRTVAGAYPRDVALVFEVGARHATFESLDVRYFLSGEEVRGVTYRQPGGLDENIDATVSLSPGRYRVEAILEGAGDRVLHERSLLVPAEGRVHIALFERGEDGGTP